MILHTDVEWVLRSWGFMLPMGKTTKESFAQLIKNAYDQAELKNRFAVDILENMPYQAEFVRQHGDRFSIVY